MTKTTVYLQRDLKRALAQAAKRRGRSEAELIREAVTQLTAGPRVPAPMLPLFRAIGPSIAQNVDAALKGFGQT